MLGVVVFVGVCSVVVDSVVFCGVGGGADDVADVPVVLLPWLELLFTLLLSSICTYSAACPCFS